MFIADEMEYERLEPICSVCGTFLTPDEYEICGDTCFYCFDYED